MDFKTLSPDDEHHDAGRAVCVLRISFPCTEAFLKLGSSTDTWTQLGFIPVFQWKLANRYWWILSLCLWPHGLPKPAMGGWRSTSSFMSRAFLCENMIAPFVLNFRKVVTFRFCIQNTSFYSESGEVWNTSKNPFEPWSVDPRDWSGDRRVQTKTQRAHGVLSNGHWSNVWQKCKIILFCTTLLRWAWIK